MRIEIRTLVSGHYQDVLSQFERPLFEALRPPGAGVEIIRFDGSETGNVVHIRLTLLGFIKQDWISDITETGDDGHKAWFIDVGRQLPFFLGAWEHHHIVEAAEQGTVVVDDIRFRGPWWLPTFLLYPVLYAQFAYRRPIYRRFFGDPAKAER